MRRLYRICLLIFALVLLLTGCKLGTVDELYCLPKRSEEYENLQAVIDKAMVGLEYCAPSNGDKRHFLQTADLDGDGVEEYLVFAKDTSDKPLKILIFCQLASGYVLMDTIEGYGFAYDFVDYAQMDDKPGLELIIGRQVNDQFLGAVSVYRFTSGFSRQLLSATYAQISINDLDNNGISEIFLLAPGIAGKSYGTARLYRYQDQEIQPSAEILLSASMSGFKLMTTANLADGTQAIYVTCASSSVNLVTDIFAVQDGALHLTASGISTRALHNYYVYPDDMDGDGVVELPRLLPLEKREETDRQEYIIEWYVLDSSGQEQTKGYTYHNYPDNWYLKLTDEMVAGLSVVQTDDCFAFYINGALMFRIYALMDADKEDQSQLENRIVLYSGESVIYTAELEDAAFENGYEALLEKIFHPIRVDVITERD